MAQALPATSTSSTTTTTATPPPQRGLKRLADDGLEGEQRLSKRFHLLNLDHANTTWHLPPPSNHRSPSPSSADNDTAAAAAGDDEMQLSSPPASPPLAPASGAPHLTLLPEYDRQIGTLPPQLLRAASAPPPRPSPPPPPPPQQQRQALVLYRPPGALGVAREEGVRKAILEARARAREAEREREREKVLTHDWRGMGGAEEDGLCGVDGQGEGGEAMDLG